MILMGAMYLLYIDTSSALGILVVYGVSIYNKYMCLVYVHIFTCFRTVIFAIFLYFVKGIHVTNLCGLIGFEYGLDAV